MKIISKIIRNLFILLGIGLAVLIILIAIMFFTDVKIFGYAGVSPSRNGATLPAIEMSDDLENLELMTHGIPVEISIVRSDDSNKANRIVIKNQLQGIVKQRKSFDNTLKKTTAIEALQEESPDGKSFSVEVFEPKRIIAFYRESLVSVILNEATYARLNLTLKTKGSHVTLNAPKSTIASVQYETTSKAGKLTMMTNISKLSANITNARIDTMQSAGVSTYNVGEALITTDGAVLIFDKVDKLTVRAKNSYVKFLEVQNLQYTGAAKDTVTGLQREANGGKIVGNIAKNMEVRMSTGNIDITNVTGDAKIASSSRIGIAMGHIENGATVNISVKNGSGNFGDIESKKFDIVGNGFKVNAVFASSAKDAQANIETQDGSVRITGQKVRYNEATKKDEIFSHQGKINITTQRGGITLRSIACTINAQVENKANIDAELLNGVQTMTSLRSAKGDITIAFQRGTKCFATVFGSKGRKIVMNNAQQTFAEAGLPTAFYGAQEGVDTKLILILAHNGKVTIGEFN